MEATSYVQRPLLARREVSCLQSYNFRLQVFQAEQHQSHQGAFLRVRY